MPEGPRSAAVREATGLGLAGEAAGRGVVDQAGRGVVDQAGRGVVDQAGRGVVDQAGRGVGADPAARTLGGDPTGRNLLFLREEELRLAQDLLFFGYRDFTAGPDAILAELGMGRAHHRVLHFVGRRPGITVGDLLAILGITKQSLARVLQPLITAGHVVQAPGRNDRRQRLLSLTPQGAALERRLFERQREVVTRAYREAGPASVEGFRRVMHGLMGAAARTQLEAQPATPAGASPAADADLPARRKA